MNLKKLLSVSLISIMVGLTSISVLATDNTTPEQELTNFVKENNTNQRGYDKFTNAYWGISAKPSPWNTKYDTHIAEAADIYNNNILQYTSSF